MNNDTSTSADDVSEDDHLLVLAPDARADEWVTIRQAARAEDALYEVRCLWLAWTPQYRATRGTWTSGDLQLGERYVNMDYLFSASQLVLPVVISYDEICRSNQVSRLHAAAHVETCQMALRWLGNGNLRHDGGEPERGWERMRRLAKL
ncbi:hypothetical protein B0H14DRAFT_3489151 [Mycena olivaceomarginata]|nr:hypothetical protein B0H14DRAFT_3489151 [Mycena olivaceomarginata]